VTDAAPAIPPTPATRIVELPYHRLYRADPNYRWWRPLAAVLLTAVFFLVVNILLSIVLIVALFASGTLTLELASSPTELTEFLLPDMARPWTLLFGLGAIILVLPLIPLALRIAGIRPSGMRLNVLHSVLFRLRWRWLLSGLIWSTVLWGAITGLQLAIGLAAGDELSPFALDPGTYVVSLLIVLLLVPVQAATEEYLYRGVLLQAIGSWVPWSVLAIVLSAVLFSLSHIYDVWGLLQVGIMGVGFAYVTVRTGGLEAAIALHTVNNIGSFAITGTGVFSGGETGMSTETGGPIAVVFQLVTVGLWLLLVEWRFRALKVERLSRIEVPVAGIPPAATR